MNGFSILTRGDVQDERSFASYCHQQLGTPSLSGSHIPILRKKLKEFHSAWSPRPGWITLARTVDWCRAKKRRPAYCWAVIPQVRFAWSDGFLPELDPNHLDEALENGFREALRIEQDPDWRLRLLAAPTDSRGLVLASWYRKGNDESVF